MGSSDSGMFWVIVLVIGFVLVVGVIVFLMMRGRAKKLSGLAAARGLRYTKRDDAKLGQFGGELYALNVVEGERNGRPFVVYDSTRTQEDDEGGTSKSVAVVAVGTGRRVPDVRCVRRKGLFGGNRGVQTGDPDFDKRFTTTASDGGFAAAVLTPPVRQLLLAGKVRWFACRGDAVVLCTDGKYPPAGLDGVVDRGFGLAGAIDPSVWDRLPPA